MEGEEFTMFRRARVMLDDLPAVLRSEPAATVELSLTQEDGSPRCAGVAADLLTWRVDED